MSLLIDLKNGRFDIAISGGLKRYLIPGLGIVDVETQLQVVPGPGGKGSRVIGKAQAWVRRLDNRFFAGADRRPAAADHRSRARQRRHPASHQPPALFAQAPAVGAGHPAQGRHLPDRGARAAGAIWAAEAAARRADRAAQGRAVPRAAERGARHSRHAAVPRSRRRRASPIAPMASRGSGRSRPTARSCCPRAAGRRSPSPRSTSPGRTARGALRADPGGFTGELRLAGGGIDGTLGFSPVGGDQKIEAHLAGNNVSLAGPPAFSVRSGRIDGTIILAEGRTTLDGVVTARGLTTSGVSLARLTANAHLVNGVGRGARGAGRDAAAPRSSW